MPPGSRSSSNLVANFYPCTDSLFSVDHFLTPIDLYYPDFDLNYSHLTGLTPNGVQLEANVGTNNWTDCTTPSNSNNPKQEASVACEASGLVSLESLLVQYSSPGTHMGNNSEKGKTLK